MLANLCVYSPSIVASVAKYVSGGGELSRDRTYAGIHIVAEVIMQKKFKTMHRNVREENFLILYILLHVTFLGLRFVSLVENHIKDA